MIKFFRHIRKSLLSKGKTSKYFKYAIGEIVLVVIGILIALQINNWNEERKLKMNERDVIASLIEDLEIDYNHFAENKIHLEKQLSIVDQLISDPHDSVMKTFDLGYLRYNTDLYPISFENKIPTNIYDKKIIESIKTYYRDQQTIMNSKGDYANVVITLVRPFLRKYGVHNPKAAFTSNFDTEIINLLDEDKLSKHYKSEELGQILFELRLKAAEFIYYLDKMSQENKVLITILKEYTND